MTRGPNRRLDLAPWDAIVETTKALGANADDNGGKYPARGWEESPRLYSRHYESMMGHLIDWFQHGIREDPETGLSPLAHAAARCLMLLAHELRGDGRDDRPCSTMKRTTTPTDPSRLR